MSTALFSAGAAPEPGRIRALRVSGMLLCVAGLAFAAGWRISWQQQCCLATLLLLSALALGRNRGSVVVTLAMILLSLFSTARYGVWRVVTVAHLLRGPGTHLPVLHAVFPLCLLCAEGHTIFSLALGYFQMAWPLRRAPVSLPADADLWPEVDLLIPTLHEPLQVVKYTALAAMNMDWPPEKLNVYVLDDGRREEVRSFCAEAGIGYMIRDSDEGAKAGNINCALERLRAPFVAIFDADHVPVRSFLQLTMGWFERDPMLGLLQTPHHLYSPDPFERNLRRFRAVPNEGELFYGVVQDGNDLWNAAYFCGTGSVLRRAALDSVGGLATETLTEDAHTSLRLQKNGWNSAYINLPLVAGLATERLSAHIRQRRRWATGMVQMLRRENPLFARGLTLPQRLCYFHAAVHFLNAWPRLIFLLAPLVYLVLGRTAIPGYWAAVLAYAVPHLALGYMANARLQGAHRFSFWNEVYDTVVAPFLLVPTLTALMFPRMGRFHATVKGEMVEREFFDTRAAWPLLSLFAANVLGLLCAGVRLMPLPAGEARSSVGRVLLHWAVALHRANDTGAVCVNVGWTLFNLAILSVALGAARESRQRRKAVRLQRAVQAGLVFADGRWIQGTTEDVSSGGVLIHSKEAITARAAEAVSVVLWVQGQETVLPATVVEAMPRALRVHFDPLTLREEEALAMLLYSPANSWVGWGEAPTPDRPLRSFGGILRLAAEGIGHGLHRLLTPAAARVVALLLCVSLLALWPVLRTPVRVRAQAGPAREARAPSSPEASVMAHSTTVERTYPLRELTSAQPIVLESPAGSRGMHFEVAANQLIERADLQVRYRFVGPSTVTSRLQVLLNGVAVPTASTASSHPLESSPAGDRQAQWRDLTVALPAELLVGRNELLLRYTAQSATDCSEHDCSGSKAEIDTVASALHLAERPLTMSGQSRSAAQPGIEGQRSPLRQDLWRRWLLAGRNEVLPAALSRGKITLCVFAEAALCCLALPFLLCSALRQRALARLLH